MSDHLINYLMDNHNNLLSTKQHQLITKGALLDV